MLARGETALYHFIARRFCIFDASKDIWRNCSAEDIFNGRSGYSLRVVGRPSHLGESAGHVVIYDIETHALIYDSGPKVADSIPRVRFIDLARAGVVAIRKEGFGGLYRGVLRYSRRRNRRLDRALKRLSDELAGATEKWKKKKPSLPVLEGGTMVQFGQVHRGSNEKEVLQATRQLALSGRNEEAAAICEEFVQREAGSVNVWMELVSLSISLDDSEGTLAAVAQVCRRSDDPELLYRCGRVLVRFCSAASILKQTRVEGMQGPVIDLVQRLEAKCDPLHLAHSCFSKAIDRIVDIGLFSNEVQTAKVGQDRVSMLANCHLFRGVLFRNEGKLREARGAFEESLVVWRSPVALYYLADLLAREGAVDKAIEALSDPVAMNNRDLRSLMLLSRLAFRERKFDLAIEAARLAAGQTVANTLHSL